MSTKLKVSLGVEDGDLLVLRISGDQPLTITANGKPALEIEAEGVYEASTFVQLVPVSLQHQVKPGMSAAQDTSGGVPGNDRPA